MNEERINKGTSRDKAGVPRDDASGPTTQRHRMKLGLADGEHDPYGDGEPSTKSTITNGRKGW